MSRSAGSSFAGAIQSFEENDDLLKLVSLRELPKSRYATKLAVTVYPNTKRGRKAVFSHVEVFKMVENVAGRLRESGVRPGTVCAYALPTSFESVIYFFALMWIGGIAAPIDPSLSAEEFENALRNLNAAILVTPYVDDDDDDLEAKAASAVKSLGICGWHIHRTINEGVLLETHSQVLGAGAAWAGGAGDFKIDPDEIAIHMSSAIAVVPLSHRVLCYAAKSFVSTYGAPISESTVLAAPLHEMHGILVLISLFYYGGHVVLPGFGGFTSEKFWDLAKKHQVTWLSASQEQVLDLYEDIQKSAAPASAITPLSFIRVEGQNSIAPEILQEMEKTFGSTVFESYGTAESCGFATTNRSDRTRHGTQGTSVNGCAVAIFDHSTRECCAPGVAGEIAVTGLHVTSSYLDSSSAQDSAIFETEEIRADEFGETKVVNTWFATGDRGTIDEEGYLVVHGNSRTLRAAELAAMEKLRLEEQAEAERKAKLEMQEKLAAEERRAEEARLQEERELQLKREEEKRIEEERKKEEEEKREQKAREAAALAADLDARERKLRELEALTRAGVQNPEDLDEETANAILRRLEAIEENHRRLQADLESRNADELEEMRLRVAEAEAEAASALNRDGNAQGPMMIDVRMEELEAAVMAAAASAESSANNTREAVKAAREVAEATHGTNRSQPVDIKPSTGDQGALTKTVRVALDEVERAMQQHPAVEVAKAFGRKDKKFGAEVFCAITPKRGARVSEPWLKLFAQSQLAAAMVPRRFYYMAEIPKNITRRELAESPLLKDLSSFAGYTEVKHVKGPSWKPAKDRTKRPPMGI